MLYLYPFVIHMVIHKSAVYVLLKANLEKEKKRKKKEKKRKKRAKFASNLILVHFEMSRSLFD